MSMLKCKQNLFHFVFKYHIDLSDTLFSEYHGYKKL